jgi:hypothetical protein
MPESPARADKPIAKEKRAWKGPFFYADHATIRIANILIRLTGK